MRDDELDGLIYVSLQIRFQKLQLLRREVVGLTIIQDGEMRLRVIETVVLRMRRVLLKQRRGTRRPNVMISGGYIQLESPVEHKDPLELPPFGFRSRVIQTLD